MSEDAPIVRLAVPGDRCAVQSTVAAAFANDPAWAFMLGASYERLAGQFAAALFDARVGSQTVWVTDDAAAVAMWEAPGPKPANVDTAEIWARFRASASAEVSERLAAYSDAVSAAAASSTVGDYWYLGVLATHPERQRRGLASRVIEPVLDMADNAGLACCLETSTVENRRFYERRGFTDATDVVVAGGPPTWWLRRKAAPASSS